MDSTIFGKYKSLIEERVKEKKEIITFIYEKTNILFKEQEIAVNKKTRIININTSSNKRMLFVLKKGEESLKEKLYNTVFG